MRHAGRIVLLAFVFLAIAGNTGQAQKVKWVTGGNMGLSISTGAGSSAGFHFGPYGEVVFNKDMGVGTEFNINTQAGTPIEWSTYFKYYLTVQGSKLRPYIDGGFGLWFYTGGPYFGIRFGGGVGFPIAKGLLLGPDLQLGPIFATGSTIFGILIRGNLRYEIPG
jgi:hypothetical protein